MDDTDQTRLTDDPPSAGSGWLSSSGSIETPSPQLVAAAGDTGATMAGVKAGAWLTLALVGIIATAM